MSNLTINRRDMAWFLVRAAGIWMLVMGLCVLPSLVLSLPKLTALILSWGMVTDGADWHTLLSHNPVGPIASLLVRMVAYFGLAGWLTGRADGLIDRLSRDGE